MPFSSTNNFNFQIPFLLLKLCVLRPRNDSFCRQQFCNSYYWPLSIIILYQFLHSKNKGNLDNLCGQRGGWRRQWENVVSARTPLSSLPRNHICTIWREHRTPDPPQTPRYDDAKAFQAGIHCAPGTSCQKLLKTHLSNFQYCKISLFKLSWQSHTNMVVLGNV